MSVDGGSDVRRRPTIAEVAAAAGVSRTTVSHALNGIGKVSPRTRALVQQIAAEVGYRPSPRAKALRGGRSNVLGVASSMSSAIAGGPARLGFFMEVAAAAAERALTHGYALVLVPPVGPDPQASSDALHGIAMDGLIVVEPAVDDLLVAHARRERLPFVCVGRPPAVRAGESWVDLNVTGVAQLLVQHVVDQGSRRPVLMIGDKDRLSYRAAVRVLRSVAKKVGWEVVVVRVPEASGEEGGKTAVMDLMAVRPDTDAVIAFVDAFATGVVRGLHELGLRIPEDVIVVTRYDGVRAKTSAPPLTAVDLGLSGAASRAVDLLVGQLGDTIDDPPAPHPERQRLVERASSLRRQQNDGA